MTALTPIGGIAASIVADTELSALRRWNSRAVDTLAQVSAYLDTFTDHRTVYGRELAEALKADVDGLVRDGAHLRRDEQLAASVQGGAR